MMPLRPSPLLLATFILCAVAGCGGTRSAEAIQAQLSLDELDRQCLAYADRYMTVLVAACDELVRDNPSPIQRREAHRLKITGVSGVYDIVTSRDRYNEVLDLTTVVTLQSQTWIDEGLAESVFAERAPHLIRALRQLRLEAWDIAAQALRPGQLQELDWLIQDWRAKHRAVRFSTFVRFDGLGDERARALATEVQDGGGFLAPISDATAAVRDVQALAERAFYFSKRLPFLASWQAESSADDLLAHPEIASLASELKIAATAATQIATSIAQMPGLLAHEREALVKAAEDQQKSAGVLVTQIRAALVEGGTALTEAGKLTTAGTQLATELKHTVDAANETLKTAMPLLAAPPGATADAPKGRPFDVTEYTAAATQLGATIRELNVLLSGLRAPDTTRQIQDQLQAVDRTAAERIERTRGHIDALIDRILWRAVALIVLFFALLTAYRLLVARRTVAGGKS